MKNSCIQILLIGFSLVGASLVGMEETPNLSIRLMILNGASCAGKTTLARELREYAHCKGIPNILHMSFDDIFVAAASDPYYIEKEKAYFERIKRVTFYADPHKKPAQHMMECYFTIFYHQIVDRMRQGFGVIADHCFSTHEGFLDFLDIFKDHGDHVALIKVFCSDQVAQNRLEKRNQSGDERQKRALWCFRQHYDRSEKGKYPIIYGNKEYDYELDTSDISPKTGAEQIFKEFFVDNHATNAFNNNREVRKDDLDGRFNN